MGERAILEPTETRGTPWQSVPDGLSEADARARLNAQWPIEEKVARGDYIIRTDGTLSDTDAQVRTIYELLIADC